MKLLSVKRDSVLRNVWTIDSVLALNMWAVQYGDAEEVSGTCIY